MHGFHDSGEKVSNSPTQDYIETQQRRGLLGKHLQAGIKSKQANSQQAGPSNSTETIRANESNVIKLLYGASITK